MSSIRPNRVTRMSILRYRHGTHEPEVYQDKHLTLYQRAYQNPACGTTDWRRILDRKLVVVQQSMVVSAVT